VANRSRDWLNQAEKDLEQARSSQREGRHEWACFAAHQSAEKAIKAIHPAKGQAWGHVLTRLLRELPFSCPEHLVEKAKVLNNFYVPTRYPSGHPEGTPFEHYGNIQSTEAVQFAAEGVQYARDQMAESGGT
jgi:HEPN domain-containing protein